MSDLSDSSENDVQEKEMTPHDKEVHNRRMKVDEMLPYYTEGEIAENLKVDIRTIGRDVAWLNENIRNKEVKELAENGYSYITLKAKRRLEDKLLKMHRIEREIGEDPEDLEDLISLWKIQNDTESLLNNIVGLGPTLQGMKKAINKANLVGENDKTD